MNRHPLRRYFRVLAFMALPSAFGGELALAQATYANLGRDLAATCANCHGTDGVSSGEVPSLAGQRKEELVRKMQAFKGGGMQGTIMPQLAKGYTDAQIEAVAAWFAAQKMAAK